MPSCVDNAGEALRRAAEGPPLAADPARRADAGYGRRIPGAGALPPCPRPGRARSLCSSSMSRHFDANMLKRIGIAHYLHKPVAAQRELHQVIAGILLPTPVVATAPAPLPEPVRDQTGLHILLAEDNLVNQRSPDGCWSSWVTAARW
ncbi:hypothetical protein LNP26_28720 [Klebsiella variicola subsp. variicola]|nr:hypothetical protein [Klebsiella variicola subsp. variicola]